MENRYFQEYQEKLMSAQDAVKTIHDGDRVYIGQTTSTAYQIAQALAERKDELRDVTLLFGNIGRPMDILKKPAYAQSAYFLGAENRADAAAGRLDYTSFHLSQVDIWCKEIAKATVVCFEVATMNEEGYFNFGASGTVLNTYLLETADRVIVQVNRNAPHCSGEYNKVHISSVDIIVEGDMELDTIPNVVDPNHLPAPIRQISDYLVEQIPDGSVIQFGNGRIPASIGYGLREKNDLGIHTEMFSDSMMELMERGVVTNRYKQYLPGRSVGAFVQGSQRLYHFVDNNPDVYLLPAPIVNSPYCIGQNDNMRTINTCLYVDLTGQVVSENINGKQYSGIGGQVDYVRGAQISKGGKAFIATESTFRNKNGETCSHIVFGIPTGTPVTTSRADVQYVVTEYGCVNLKVLSMRDRVRAMISLAHPDFREVLMDQAKENGLL